MTKNLSAAVACAFLLLIAGTAQAATVSRTILNDGSTLALFNPAAATDSHGNIHIVAQGMDATAPGTGVEDIYYMLVRPNGTILIDASIINTDGNRNHGRPRIAVTSDDKAVVSWAGGGLAVTIAEIDPSLDPTQDGGALDPAAIVTPATAVGTSTSSGHHNMALDSNNIAHIVMNRSSTLFYIAVDPSNASVVNPEVSLGQSLGSRRVDPGIAVDSSDNLHLVFASSTVDSNAPASYMMLDNTGAVLIAATQLYDAAAISPHASQFSIFVTSNDDVHIVYGDKRNTLDASSWCNTDCSQGGTMIYARLRPSNDPQDGSASDMTTLRVGNEVELGNEWYSRAFLNGSTIHMFSSNKGGGNITHTSIGVGGTHASAPRRVAANVAQPGWSRKLVTAAGSKVIWSEGIFSPTLVGGTLQLVMANMGAFSPPAGGGGGGAPAPLLLAVFGLAGLARALRKRH